MTADYVDKVSKGVIPPRSPTEYKGQYNVIKTNLNNMVAMMNDLLAETGKIVKAAADGQLDQRADAAKFVGGWNQLVSGVNDTITNIVNPLMVTADYVDKVSKGVIPPTIMTEYKGQYNVIKTNLNNMVAMMNDLLAETGKIVKAAADGQLDQRADAAKFVGGWNQLVAGVNDTITNIVNPLMVTADYVDGIARAYPGQDFRRVPGPVQHHQDQPQPVHRRDQWTARRGRNAGFGRGRGPAGHQGQRRPVPGQVPRTHPGDEQDPGGVCHSDARHWRSPDTPGEEGLLARRRDRVPRRLWRASRQREPGRGVDPGRRRADHRERGTSLPKARG